MYKIIVGIVTICLGAFVVIKLINRPAYERAECLSEKKLEFSGIVDTIVQDKKNLSQSFIILKNGKKILPDYTYGLWIEVQPHDSIVKKRGTLNYIIYKGGNKENVKQLNWDRKCR